jgi:hypothetical protein
MKTMELTDEEIEIIEKKRRKKIPSKTYPTKAVVKHDLYYFDEYKYEQSNFGKMISNANYDYKTEKDIEADSKIIKEFEKEYRGCFELAAKAGSTLIYRDGYWKKEEGERVSLHLCDPHLDWAEENLTNIKFEETK